MAHRYNGLLLRHKKGQYCAMCRDMDGLRDCHIEWSKPEREKHISYINVYMWNLKMYRWAYLQSRNRDTGIENICMNTEGRRGRWDEMGDWDWHMYTAMYKIES